MSELNDERVRTGISDQSESNVATVEPVLTPYDEVFEMNEEFNLDGFQVVRREFFAHLREPAVTFNNRKFYVNSACLSKFPHVDYVQTLVNPKTKILALRPCQEGTRGSFQWCNDKRKPRQTTCTLFFAKMFTLMGWNPDYRYKLLGNVIHANGEYLIAFDLTSTEVYQKTFDENKIPTTSRKPVFPAGWQDQFGMPFQEHRQSMLINIFDGYAIYSIKDNKAARAKEQQVLDANITTDAPALLSTGGVLNA